MVNPAAQPVMFLDRVREDILRRNLIPTGSHVVAAVSGGPDSTALLLALLHAAPEFGWTVSAAHYNHQMRPEADADEAFVSDLCESLSVTLSAARSSTLAPGSSEESAREERLAFLRDAAARIGASLIATGHTADDRAETVLLNIIRGAGTDGLRGIRWSSGPFVRPLLGRTSGEVRGFLEARGQPWRSDQSNASAAYARNRLRHQVIPLLETEFNADVRGALLRLAETAGDDADHLNESARAILPGLTLDRDKASARLSSSALRDTPLALARRAVRAVLVDLLLTPRDITLPMVERIISAAAKPVPAFDAGLGIRVWSDESSVTIALPAEEPVPFDRDLPPGLTEVPEARCSFQVGDVEDPTAEHMLRIPAVRGRLHVRSWRPGDRMRPKGLGGSKKLQDIFTDARVPREERARFPVVCAGDEILWLPGLAVSEAAAPGPLVISMHRLTS